MFHYFQRYKRYCYAFVVSGILSFFLAALIRSGQFVICDKNEVTKIKGRVHPYLPPLYKVTFIWLVCQLFWYWLVLSLVAALLNWMHAEELADEEGRKTPVPSTSSGSNTSSTAASPAPPQQSEEIKEPENEKEKENEKN